MTVLVELQGLRFGLLSSSDIKQRSVVNIDENIINRRNKLVANTINDPRLGTVTSNGICAQCGNGMSTCTGHIGALKLADPVISAHFITHICKILSCICIRCSQLLIPRTHHKLNMVNELGQCWKKRINFLFTLAIKYRNCIECRNLVEEKEPICFQQPDRYILVENTFVRPVYDLIDSSSLLDIPIITAKHLVHILRNVDTETCSLLGFGTSLETVFLSRFMIPPLLIRPSRGGTMEDDLTIRLRQIVRANQHHITTDIDLTMVIIGGVQQLQTMSKIHTRNKTGVCEQKFDTYFELSRQVLAYQDNRLFNSLDIDYGRDRQSIHSRFKVGSNGRGRVRGNLLGKRGDFTARLVASPSTHINIDECGLPIGVLMKLTVAERVTIYNYNKMLVLVHNGANRYPGCNFIFRPTNKMSLSTESSDDNSGFEIYNYLLANGGLQIGDVVHRHVQRGDWVFVNRQPTLHRFSMMAYKVIPTNFHTAQIHLSVTPPLNADFDGDELNIFIPGDLHCQAEAMELMAVRENLYKDGSLVISLVQHACLGAYMLTSEQFRLPTSVAIQYLFQAGFEFGFIGHEVSGKSIMKMLVPIYDPQIQLSKKSINYLLARYLIYIQPEAAITFMSRLNRFLEHIAVVSGTSLSFYDCCTNLSDAVHTYSNQSMVTIQSIWNEFKTLTKTEAELEHTDVEDNICKLLDNIRDFGGQYSIQTIKQRKRHPLVDIVASGAKGNDGHIVQNAAIVGQQLNNLSKRNLGSTRHEYATHAAKYGFVSSSFSKGLNAQEFFFHTMSARVGLIATAVDTAQTGYSQRRISKCLEDLKITFDTSVRDMSNRIFMVQYGFDTTHLRIYHIPMLNVSTSEFISFHTIHNNIDELEHLSNIRYRLLNNKRFLDTVHLPIDLDELVRKYTQKKSFESIDSYTIVLAGWKRMINEFNVPYTIDIQYCFFYYLSTRNLFEHGYTISATKALLGDICRSFTSNIIQNGTPIGQRASQSFTAPLTQLNLDRFHISGEKTELVGGVARINEIINLTQTSTPSMTIYTLDDTFDALSIISLTLQRVTLSWHDNIIFADDQMVVLVLELDKQILTARHIPPRLIAEFILSNKHIASILEDTVCTYSTLHEDTWRVVLQVKQCSALWNCCDNNTHAPMLSMRLSHMLLFEDKRLLAGISKIYDFYETSRAVNIITDDILTTVQKRVIITLGSNLMEICCLPGVDIERTTTNQISEIYEVFGIDATCHMIETSLVDVMLASAASVSRKHIHIIAAAMCMTGVPKALTFVGMSHGQMSHLKLATFERALDSFVSAGVYGLYDNLYGVSESIITGTKIKLGTGGDVDIRSLPYNTKYRSTVPSSILSLTHVPILPIPTDDIIRARMSIQPTNHKPKSYIIKHQKITTKRPPRHAIVITEEETELTKTRKRKNTSMLENTKRTIKKKPKTIMPFEKLQFAISGGLFSISK